MSKVIKNFEAVRVICKECGFKYKTSNLETTKCIECKSRDIEVGKEILNIKHKIDGAESE